MFGIIVCSFISLVFISLGIYSIQKNNELKLSGRKTKAQIIGYNEKKDNDSFSTYYYPQIKFTTPDNETIIKTLNYSTTWRPSKNLPNNIYLYYLKNLEGEFEILIDKKLYSHYLPYTFLIFGVLVLLIVIIYIIFPEKLEDLLKSASKYLEKIVK